MRKGLMRLAPRVLRGVVIGAALVVCLPVMGYGQQPSRAAAGQNAAAPAARVFGSEAGLVLNFIKADKAADFENVMAKLKTALQKSPKPERKQQAAGWKVYRAVEPGANNSVLYLFVINPAVKDADYTVANILAEGFPEEVQTLYKQYSEAYAGGQSIVNLQVLTNLAP